MKSDLHKSEVTVRMVFALALADEFGMTYQEALSKMRRTDAMDVEAMLQSYTPIRPGMEHTAMALARACFGQPVPGWVPRKISTDRIFIHNAHEWN